MNDSLQCALRMSMPNIQMLEKHIEETDKIIAKSMQGIQTPLPSIPGFGPVITVGLVAEIGSIERLSDQGKLARYAGLIWNEHQSGDFVGDETRKLTGTYNYYAVTHNSKSVGLIHFEVRRLLFSWNRGVPVYSTRKNPKTTGCDGWPQRHHR